MATYRVYLGQATKSLKTLHPTLFVDADTFFTPRVNLTIRPALFTDSDTFFTPTITLGAPVLRPTLFTDIDVFYTPTVTNGPVNVRPTLFVDSDTFFNPVISLRAGGGSDKKKRGGFDRVIKQPPAIRKPEHPKVWTPPPEFVRSPSISPRRPAPDLIEPELIPTDLPGMLQQMRSAEDISDVNRFLEQIEQDEQDAADIADILALLDD